MVVKNNKMEFEGKDVAEAISKACKALNVPQENLEIEVLTTGTSGIFGLCRQKARLRVAVKKQEAEPGEETRKKSPARAKKQPAKPVEQKKEIVATETKKVAKGKPPVEKVEQAENKRDEGVVLGEELLLDVKGCLEQILALMNYPSEITVSSDREYVTVLIRGEHVEEIIEQNGKLLDSLQYLLRKIIGKKYSEKAIISLDAGDFRATRTEELREQAVNLAAEVKKSGKTRSIPSLNPSERRVVHLALQDDKEIRSRSVGEGLFKKVLIYRPGAKGKKGPARKKKGSRNKK